MALRSIEPFLNLAYKLESTFNGYSGVWSAVNVPFMLYSGDSNGYPRTISMELDADGWLLVSSTGSVSGERMCVLIRPFASAGITFTADSVVFGGVRMKVGGYTPRYLITTQGGSATPLIIPSDVPGFALNKEFYIEWCLDLPNNLIRRRVDGVEIAPVAMSAAIKNALIAGTNHLGYGSWVTGSSAAQQFFLKDGYILEKTPDGLMSSWLGPQTIRKLPVAEVVAPWTATGDIPLKDALNTPINSAASRLTPLVTTDVDATQGTIKFDSSSVKGKLNGIAVNISMSKQSGKVGNFEASLTNGGVESSKVTVAGTNDMLMNPGVLLSSKAPNGNAWSAETLATATLKLKPV